MNIKAIVFDMGGVLIDLDYDRCVAAYKALGFEEICDSDFKKVGIGISDFFDQAFKFHEDDVGISQEEKDYFFRKVTGPRRPEGKSESSAL